MDVEGCDDDVDDWAHTHAPSAPSAQAESRPELRQDQLQPMRGIRGSRVLQAAIRDIELPVVGPRPGSAEHARRFRRAGQRQSNQWEGASSDDAPARVSTFKLAKAIGHESHKVIVSCLQQWAAKPTAKSLITSKLLSSQRAPQMSFAALAAIADVSPAHAARTVARCAAAVQLASDLSWGTLLANVAEMLSSSPVMKGVLMLTHARYDETPSRMRVDAEGNTFGSGGPESGGCASMGTQGSCIAKIFQIEYAVTMLFQRTDTGAFHVITGSSPRMLAAVDKTSAANIRAVLEQRCYIPEFLRAAKLFEWRVRAVCTDRYAANFAAEEAMQSSAAEKGAPYTRDHSACEVHMLATTQTKTMQLTELEAIVEGMIACALTMSGARARATLRRHLLAVFQEQCVFLAEDPPQGRVSEYREELYKHFLPLYPGVDAPSDVVVPNVRFLRLLLKGLLTLVE